MNNNPDSQEIIINEGLKALIHFEDKDLFFLRHSIDTIKKILSTYDFSDVNDGIVHILINIYHMYVIITDDSYNEWQAASSIDWFHPEALFEIILIPILSGGTRSRNH